MNKTLEQRIRSLKRVIKFRNTDDSWKDEYSWAHGGVGQRYEGRLEALQELKAEEKRTITLEGGQVVDCGVKEFNSLTKSMKEQSPKKITKATIKLMLSSDDMMKALSDKAFAVINGDCDKEIRAFMKKKKAKAKAKRKSKSKR